MTNLGKITMCNGKFHYIYIYICVMFTSYGKLPEAKGWLSNPERKCKRHQTHIFLNDDMIITGVLKHLGFNRCHGHARWQKEPITNRLGISTASCHARSAGQCNRQYPAIPAMGETIRARDL